MNVPRRGHGAPALVEITLRRFKAEVKGKRLSEAEVAILVCIVRSPDVVKRGYFKAQLSMFHQCFEREPALTLDVMAFVRQLFRAKSHAAQRVREFLGRDDIFLPEPDKGLHGPINVLKRWSDDDREQFTDRLSLKDIADYLKVPVDIVRRTRQAWLRGK